jgi:iron complex transport system ATP-binding protein
MMVKGLRVKFGDKVVIDNVTFELKEGVTLLLGPNGSGKTTLLRTMIGMVKLNEGEVSVDLEKLSYSPSEFFSPSMKVWEVLSAGRKRGNYERYVKLLGLDKFMQRDFSTLSSGEKRLVLVAKALGEGNLVIMDEPFSNVDFANKFKIIAIMSQLKNEKLFLITAHELDVINYVDRVILLKNGKIIYEGEPKGLSDELLSFAYNYKVKRVDVNGKFFFTPEF